MRTLDGKRRVVWTVRGLHGAGGREWEKGRWERAAVTGRARSSHVPPHAASVTSLSARLIGNGAAGPSDATQCDATGWAVAYAAGGTRLSREHPLHRGVSSLRPQAADRWRWNGEYLESPERSCEYAANFPLSHLRRAAFRVAQRRRIATFR